MRDIQHIWKWSVAIIQQLNRASPHISRQNMCSIGDLWSDRELIIHWVCLMIFWYTENGRKGQYRKWDKRANENAGRGPLYMTWMLSRRRLPRYRPKNPHLFITNWGQLRAGVPMESPWATRLRQDSHWSQTRLGILQLVCEIRWWTPGSPRSNRKWPCGEPYIALGFSFGTDDGFPFLHQYLSTNENAFAGSSCWWYFGCPVL